MKTNAAALALIQEFEGFRASWYSDPVGVKTIGYGHTDAAGHPRYADNKALVLTKADAQIVLSRDLGQYEAAVTKAVTVPLNENQFGALVSFTYNLGAGNLQSSTLLRKLNAGDYAGAGAEFPRWNKAGGRVLAGLTRRRAAERALFEKPVATAPQTTTTEAPSGGIIAAIAAFFTAIFGGKS